MFIKLTNASPAHKDKPVILNTANIVSVHQGTAVRVADEDGAVIESDEVTFVFVPPHGTWEVSETTEQIAAALAACVP